MKSVTSQALRDLRSCLPQCDAALLRLKNQVLNVPEVLLSNGRSIAWQDHANTRPGGELCGRIGGHPIALATENLSTLEPRLLDLESLVPPETCTVLVGHALAPVIALIERLARLPMTDLVYLPLPDDPAAPPQSSMRIGFSLLGKPGERDPEVRGWLQGDAAFWRSLDPSRISGPTLTARHHLVPLTFNAHLGTCRLSVNEFQHLAVGDALRLTPRLTRQPDHSIPLQLRHPSGRLGGSARLRGHELILETPMKPATLASSTSTIDAGLAADISCELHFEIGSLSMSLAEIGRLRTGQSLRLNTHLHEHPVSILSAGREIARGELAAIGDELVVVVSDTRHISSPSM